MTVSSPSSQPQAAANVANHVDNGSPVLLSHYAHAAIQKHFHKTVSHFEGVLLDRDPEDVHQMRVGMRRLRTALKAFQAAIALPEGIGDKQIGKLARALGKVRDMDVLQIWFESYLESANAKETKALQSVLDHLHQQRQQEFKQLTKTLNGKQYQKFITGFQTWLDQPTFTPVAHFSLVTVLPDLLLPLISQLLIHPGWHVATAGTGTDLKAMTELKPAQINQFLDDESEALHDLRKQMKRVRYQTEFFADFYDADFKAQTKEFRRVQELLGRLQDSAVLSEFLTEHLGRNWMKQLPQLQQQLQQERLQVWQDWQPIQAKYLTAAFRQQLRQQIMQPTANLADDTPPAPDTP
jgi:CHAD domain-containing protein